MYPGYQPPANHTHPQGVVRPTLDAERMDLTRKATAAAKLAQTIFGAALAKDVADSLRFYSESQWRCSDEHLKALILDVEVAAAQIRRASGAEEAA